VQADQGTAVIQHVAFSPRITKPSKPARYTVKRGDTLSAISQRFDISLADLRMWNPGFKKRSTVRAGQTVIVRKP
jgi:membrane-bound lytic murein transglycosylase D